VYKDLENKTVDVGGWGNVDEAKSLKNVQIVLIKLKINRGII
jgi:inorganic pyrophosphatase